MYKKEEASYGELLQASQDAEGKWTENKMARIRNANVEEANGLKALHDQVNTLASVILNTNTPKKGNGKQKAEAQIKSKKDNNRTNGNKSKGPDTGTNGPFYEGQRPIQCFKCSRWGHMAHVCLSQGNQGWRNLNGADKPPEGMGPVTPKKQYINYEEKVTTGITTQTSLPSNRTG